MRGSRWPGTAAIPAVKYFLHILGPVITSANLNEGAHNRANHVFEKAVGFNEKDYIITPFMNLEAL